MPPTALRTFPPTLSAFPSPSSLLSPVALPATSLTLPLACWAEPWMRSLSIACLQSVCPENDDAAAKVPQAWHWPRRSDNGSYAHRDRRPCHDRCRHPTDPSQTIMDGEFPHDLC